MPRGAEYFFAFHFGAVLSEYARALLRAPRSLLVALALACTLAVSQTALADQQTREIQRLLWSLDYGADRLDGNMSSGTSTRIQKFLTDRKKASLSGEPLLAELRTAFEEATAKALSANTEIVDRV